MAETATKTKQKSRPPYIPWKTLVNFITRWKSSTIPHTINTTIMANLSGGMATQLVSALRFLRLIDENGVVQPSFKALVKAHDSDQWAGAVKEHVVDAYADIVGDLPLENAIGSQLDECFRKNGGADGQVLDKCVRFYLHSLRDAEVKYSPLFSLRRERSKANGSRRKNSQKSKEPPNTTALSQGHLQRTI